MRRKFVLDVFLLLFRRLPLDPLLMVLLLSVSVARRLEFWENLRLFGLIYLFLPMIYKLSELRHIVSSLHCARRFAALILRRGRYEDRIE